jgi:hypothetical protein
MPINKIYCFRANYELSTKFEECLAPAWLSLETDSQGYKISTIPEVASVARVLGNLEIEEDTADEWIYYLESLGLKGVCQVACEEWFEDRGYS